MNSPEGDELPLPPLKPISVLKNVLLARSPKDRFDIEIDHEKGVIKSVKPTSSTQPSPSSTSHTTHSSSDSSRQFAGSLVLPSLCHPHVHLDKAHLLSHGDTQHLAPERGDFGEALSLTARAKGLYTAAGLRERGNWLVAESVRAGVTQMRGFVEVDATVGTMCVDAAVDLRRLWAGRCDIQICAFAQDPLFSGEHADENRRLMESVAARDEIEVVGSTPYVESDDQASVRNIGWLVDVAVIWKKHVDFHLDYFLDPKREPMIWKVIDALNRRWKKLNYGKTICLGHCTRFTCFTNDEWKSLAQKVLKSELPIYFVGLPTSDIFMMDRPGASDEVQDRRRATLQVPWLIDSLGLKVCLGINNVGNAFTPQGSADPVSLATLGVGLYQVGVPSQASKLYECVSTRAREAIGLATQSSLNVTVNDPANLVVFGSASEIPSPLHRNRASVHEIVYDPPYQRLTVKNGFEI